MAQHNSHRALGRAVTPVSNAPRAARGLGGAAVLGTVLMGTAFTGAGAANASDLDLPGGDEAPTATQPSQTTVSGQSSQADQASSSSSHVSSTTLRQGDQGQKVEDLQAALNAHGASLPETGFFGSMTRDAVTNFQADQGLSVDGVVGSATQGALGGSTSGSGSDSGSVTASTVGTGSSAGSTSVSVSASSSSDGGSIMSAARAAVGTPYSWGDSSLSGMDCSGLVTYAYNQAGIDIPRTSGEIAAQGTNISQSEAKPGDIVTYPGHVAIYAGDGQIIDASGSQQQVVERGIWGNPTGFVTYR